MTRINHLAMLTGRISPKVRNPAKNPPHQNRPMPAVVQAGYTLISKPEVSDVVLYHFPAHHDHPDISFFRCLNKLV